MNPFQSLRDYEKFVYTLQQNHKHIPPNIKRNRIPAPQMSFTRPNLSVIVQEIEELIQKQRSQS